MRSFLGDLFHDYGLRLLPILTGCIVAIVLGTAIYAPSPRPAETRTIAR